MILPCTSLDQDGWLPLRRALWPDCPADEHLAEMRSFLLDPGKYAQFVAYDADGRAAGFAEAALRTDYVNGTDSSPVAFLEGIYVVPGQRRKGWGRALVEAVTAWARASGCRELASDALLDNEASHRMHRALGFEETERVVFFRRALPET
ncbi:MAG TPA: aminoglycoside 6'-acetyltransferase [Massilia sp.]|nr:aminoglycoside 6'-acetyltransferase [Massilia sp.]